MSRQASDTESFARHERGSQRGRPGQRMLGRFLGVALSVLLVALLLEPLPAHALCDVVPQPDTILRGSTGSLNRVYATPGESVRVRRDPAGCEATTPAFGADPDVTLVFTPPQGLPSVVVLAGSGGGQCAALATELAACEAELPVGAAVSCLEQGASVNGDLLSFSFPDTQDVVGAPADGLPLSGSATVAVTTGGALPCQLASQRCADLGAPANLAACIDEVYASDGTCETSAVHRHPSFPGFTALPPPNDFEAICGSADPSIPCNNTGADVHLTTDAAGNLVIPMDWRGVLVPGTLPIPRLVRASSSEAAFTGPPPEPAQTPGEPIQVPGLAFLQSFSPKGLRVDPLFNPLFSEDQAVQTDLFGSVDAEIGVVRILRRSPAFRQCLAGARAGLPCVEDAACPGSSCGVATCRGGANDGLQCTSDSSCPGGECGAALFDFTDRYSDSSTGPVVLASADYDAEALNPAAIDGLESTDDLFMFVRSEPIEAKDLNLDGDQLDDTVVTIRDGKTGQAFDLGVGGAVGPASTRVRQFPFAFPAVAVEGDVLALLVSEPDEQVDENGDGDDWDAALRVFRLEGGGPVDLLGGAGGPAADGLPKIDRSSLVVSDGLVFFRESEADGAIRVIADLSSDFGQGIPTPDGRFVVALAPSDFLPGDTNQCDDVVVHDRDTDEDGIYDEPGATNTVIVTVSSAGVQGTHPDCPLDPLPPPFVSPLPLNGPFSISDDGRHVMFNSPFPDLEPGESTDRDVYVHDRDTDADGIFDESGAIATLPMNRATDGSNPGGALGGAMSADGRWVLFVGSAVFAPGDTNAASDVYVRDRDTDSDGVFDEPGAVATYRLTDALGLEPDLGTEAPDLSPDGRFAVFVSDSTNLDGVSSRGVFVLDRDADGDGVFDELGEVALRRVSLTSDGEPLDDLDDLGSPQLMAGPRRVLFVSSALSISPSGEASGSSMRFVLHDRDADGNGVLDEPGGIETRRLVRSQTSRQLLSLSAQLSPDGRIAIVNSFAPDFLTTDRIDLDTGVAAAADQGPIAGPSSESLSTASTLDGLTLAYWAAAGAFRLDGVDPSSPPNDLTGDGDQDDRVLAVLDATLAAPIAFARLAPATEVATAVGNAVFLRPEDADQTDLNGDADADDEVAQLYRNRTTLPPGENLGLAARTVAISTQYLGALASEADEGAVLNGDADLDDLVVHLNEVATATSGTWVNLALAGDALQLVNQWAAFTVPEPGQAQDLNADGDQLDRVLRVYDAATATYLPFHDPQAVPIPGVAVDDFFLGDQVVAFRVNEADQGADLNGDADQLDSVIHVADLATGTVYNSMQAAIPCPVEACDPRAPYRIVGSMVTFLTLEADQGGLDLDLNGDGGTGLVLQHFNPSALAAGGGMADACDVLAGAIGGICTTTAEACATDLDCAGAETCYFPPGGCLLDTGTACTPEDPIECTGNEFCAPVLGMPGVTTCHEITGPCLTDAECGVGEVCRDDGLNPDELFSAFENEGDGRQRFVHGGVCSDGDGACNADGNCNDGATCDLNVAVTATAADADADGLADPIDNCLDVANGDQLDTDQDGLGDACDRETCGNGIQEYTEGCDHGAQNGIDGVCAADCSYVGGGAACADGLDNDGDGLIDLVDLGCADAADASERRDGVACDNGLDDDGDYGVDRFGDAGCINANSQLEAPQCSNGIDDEGTPDGRIDWDGAGLGAPDPHCTGPSDNRERWKRCGIGFELGLVLPLLFARLLRRREAGHPETRPGG